MSIDASIFVPPSPPPPPPPPPPPADVLADALSKPAADPDCLALSGNNSERSNGLLEAMSGSLPWEPQAKAVDTETRAWLNQQQDRFTPAGRENLDRLAESGQLSPALRAELDGFVDPTHNPDSQPVAEGVLAQLALPHRAIAQANPNTCAAADAQAYLAQSNPAGYFKLVTALITHGEAPLPNGAKAPLSAENRTAIDARFPGRDAASITQKLDAMVQSAFMDYANEGADYHFNSDMNTDQRGRYAGLTIGNAMGLNQALGIPSVDARATGNDPAKLYAAVREASAAARGTPGVAVVMRGAPNDAYSDHTNHMMLVTHVAPDGKVTLGDANGGTPIEMSREQFEANVQAKDIAAEEAIGYGTTYRPYRR